MNWNVGSVSWSSGGSLAGNIVKIGLGTGSGYPSSIDGSVFNIQIVANSKTSPVKIRSCCSNNEVEL